MPQPVALIALWILIGALATWTLRSTRRPGRAGWVVPLDLGLFGLAGLFLSIVTVSDVGPSVAGVQIPEILAHLSGISLVFVACWFPGVPRLSGGPGSDPMSRIARHYERIVHLAEKSDQPAREAVDAEVRAMRRARTPETAELVRLIEADVDDWLANRRTPDDESAERGLRMKAEIRRYIDHHS